MCEGQNFEQLVHILQRRARRLCITVKGARIHAAARALRFDGFAGTVLVSRDGSSITVTQPRSDVVVFSTYLGENPVTEQGVQLCRALVHEITSILRENHLSP
ncbi:hypothetical protein RBE51_19795 [Pseudomonas taiwanensis]|uniref:hypothetical protein n=1 Tax=Pseudomonas taiwanensis TaxID=470150 RepID=UPI0028DF2ECA|nr:hypothetical protein [Pseudomonas taiwanensis]MDT8925036.1 hypothetical protein [Pseudomonas taiwanensis]